MPATLALALTLSENAVALLGQNLEKTKHNDCGISKAGQLTLSGLTRADGAERNTEQPASEHKSKLLLDAFSISSQTPRRKDEVSFLLPEAPG